MQTSKLTNYLTSIIIFHTTLPGGANCEFMIGRPCVGVYTLAISKK